MPRFELRRGPSPRAILVIGWLGLMLYAYPGYMSYDSVLQLVQARSGVFGDGHPPMMSALWQLTDGVIAGPLPMLMIQCTAFLAGAYLLLRRCMSARAAAICATLLVWFPPVSAVLAVIWKDSQMAAYLVLGTALLLSPRRGVRIVALVVLTAATAMRYNALAITLPLVVLLFVWSPDHGPWRRYSIALATWAALTLTSSLVNRALASDTERVHMWHDALALMDLTGTLRYAPDLPDELLRADLAGTPLRAMTGIQAIARATHKPETIVETKRRTFGTGKYVPSLWITTHNVFDVPTTPPEREAVTRAWKNVVLAHPGAYLEYRWRVFRELIHLGDRRIPSGAYVWFTDISDPEGSARKIGHTAVPSGIQAHLREAMLGLSTTSLFRPWIYLALSLVLLPLCVRHRDLLALVLSGLANQAALFILAPTIDYRYSFWLVVTTGLVVMMLIARRARPGGVTDLP